MPIQKREVEFTKEVDDVAVLLIGILRAARDGKDAATIASGAITDLVTALNGIDQIDDEVKLNRKVALQTIGYRTGDLVDAILG